MTRWMTSPPEQGFPGKGLLPETETQKLTTKKHPNLRPTPEMDKVYSVGGQSPPSKSRQFRLERTLSAGTGTKTTTRLSVNECLHLLNR